MKTAAKIFTIIGMIVGAFLIYPLVLGIFALRQLNDAQRAEELNTYGILTLIFVSPIAGIFFLCIKDTDLQNNNINVKEDDTKLTTARQENNIEFSIYEMELFDEI